MAPLSDFLDLVYTSIVDFIAFLWNGSQMFFEFELKLIKCFFLFQFTVTRKSVHTREAIGGGASKMWGSSISYRWGNDLRWQWNGKMFISYISEVGAKKYCKYFLYEKINSVFISMKIKNITIVQSKLPWKQIG